jgi:methionyl-tRNA formyltransferase
MVQKLKIIYMGTPEFAVAPLQELLRNGFKVVAVVSAPDKPAGRGMKLRKPAVAKFAEENNLPLLQPVNLKSQDFIDKLKSFEANLQIVVAFRMLPSVIWQMPEYGTFNLHASLLPQYRGAAPINRAIINGEKETGLTTFFLKDTIDTGNIIFSETEPINFKDTAGDLHDRLMAKGASLVVKTAQAIADSSFVLTDQENILSEVKELKTAPKIFKTDCVINWKNNSLVIYNQIRGLSPFPGAYTYFKQPDGKSFLVKVFSSHIEKENPSFPGELFTDGRTYLKISAGDGLIYLDELQLEGKRRMQISEFMRGTQINNSWQTCTPNEIQQGKTSISD